MGHWQDLGVPSALNRKVYALLLWASHFCTVLCCGGPHLLWDIRGPPQLPYRLQWCGNCWGMAGLFYEILGPSVTPHHLPPVTRCMKATSLAVPW